MAFHGLPWFSMAQATGANDTGHVRLEHDLDLIGAMLEDAWRRFFKYLALAVRDWPTRFAANPIRGRRSLIQRVGRQRASTRAATLNRASRTSKLSQLVRVA